MLTRLGDVVAGIGHHVGLHGRLLGVARHLLADRGEFFGGGGQRRGALRDAQHALAEVLPDARKGFAETCPRRAPPVEDGIVQAAFGQRRALLGENVDGILDLAEAFGLVSAARLLDGFDIETHRFQRVQQEGIADGLHVVIEDLEDGLFGRATAVALFEIAPQVDAQSGAAFPRRSRCTT